MMLKKNLFTLCLIATMLSGCLYLHIPEPIASNIKAKREKQEQKQMANYQKKCENGNLESCVELASNLKDLKQKHDLYQQTCDKGYGLACDLLASYYYKLNEYDYARNYQKHSSETGEEFLKKAENWVIEQEKKAIELLKTSCYAEEPYFWSCNTLAKIYAKGKYGVTAPDKTKSEEFLKRTNELRQMNSVIWEAKKTNSKGNTPLHAVIAAKNLSVSTEVAKLLIKKGADVNAKNNDGDTPLLVAAQNQGDNIGIVRLLVDKGADIHTKNNEGRTALHIAALRGNTDIIKLLIDNGADVNARDNNNETVLARAVLKMENPEAVRLLIQKGADVNADLGDGYTALDHVEAVMATKLTAIWSTRGVKVENAPQIKQILLNAKAKSSGQGVQAVAGSNAIATGLVKAVQFVGEAVAEGAKNTTYVGVDKPWGVSAAHICITGSDGVEYGKHGNKCSSGGTGISKKAGNYRYVVYFEDHYDHSILGYRTRVKGACSGTFSTNGTEQSIYLDFNSKLDCNDVNIYKH